MKIQFDTEKKLIRIEEKVNLNELFERLNVYLPNDEWKEYELETNTVIDNWTLPIIIDRPVWPHPYPFNPNIPIPQQPFYNWPTITCSSENNHVYNIQC